MILDLDHFRVLPALLLADALNVITFHKRNQALLVHAYRAFLADI
jgi:hypothetical protein